VLDPVLAEHPDFFASVHRLAVEGPNCVQCHFLQGDPPNAEGPIAWAPDLDHTAERLRPDWTREWLEDPSRIYPGTAMPANFPPDQDVYQELLPGTSRQQIEAILMWLFNLDRSRILGEEAPL
jgi:mono/diheme cytochrome c family protein